MDTPHVLLTNDDGIDAPGIAALYESLSAIADVTVIAPVDNQSGVGRARSNTVAIDDHEWGYAVHGTPADCVAIGLRHVDEADDIDLVVSGCNDGPNVGSYLLGHSGTVGAAVEAGFLGVPAVAVSGYHTGAFYPKTDYAIPARATRTLVEAALGRDIFSALDFLNVNAPVDVDGPMRVTRPVADYDTTVKPGEEGPRFHTSYWASRPVGDDRIPDFEEYRGLYPDWSDRAAVVDGAVSVSPLDVPQLDVDSEAVRAIVDAYNEQSERSRSRIVSQD
ncbi:5'/3'-nucleotidase SurE [Haloferacaceae archaeon DSL9]